VTRRTAERREKEEASGAEEEAEKEEEEKEARPDPGHLGPQGYSIYIMD
jgi:hypothetical protein